MDIESKRKLRTAFMRWLFEGTGGSQDTHLRPSEFRVPEGWVGDTPTNRDIWDAVRYLEGERLIKAQWAMGGAPILVRLTHEGIREMEQALSEPDRQTEHFVPLVNVTNIHGPVIGSQIQQGSPGATQTGHIEVNQRDHAAAFIAAARKVLASESLDADTRRQAEEDLEVMSRELERPRPRWQILRTFGTAVRDTLAKAAGAAAAAALMEIPWP